MGCKNCPIPDKVYPLFIVLAAIAWILILCAIVKVLWMIGFTILFWLAVAGLVLKLCHTAGEADDWYSKIKKY